MSEDELESFFGEMQESHRDVMGDAPHVCEFNLPNSLIVDSNR